ncbi:MAG: LysE family transporter [Caldilineales bacterium]
MESTLLLRGLFLGLAIAAPVGPIGVLCIRRTLAEGRIAGLVSGLGAASADALYGIVAGFGLTMVSQTLLGWQSGIRLLGGLFLLYLGGKTFFAPVAEKPAEAAARSLPRHYVSTLLLTLTNPMTILSFVAVFAGMGLAEGRSYSSAFWLVTGVFLGSALWWLTLSSAVGLLRSRITPRILRGVNRISGLVILSFAVAALLSLVG